MCLPANIYRCGGHDGLGLRCASGVKFSRFEPAILVAVGRCLACLRQRIKAVVMLGGNRSVPHASEDSLKGRKVQLMRTPSYFGGAVITAYPLCDDLRSLRQLTR